MIFEHVGLNVPDAKAMADWYIRQCGMRAVRRMDQPPHTAFLADASGRVVLEIYTNPKAVIPDYRQEQPLRYHFAMATDDPGADKDRMIAEGATLESDDRLEDGSRLIMLRDPWGIPLQLCKRAVPMS